MQTSEQKEAFLHSWFDVPENVHWAHGMSNEVEKEVSESFDRAIAAWNTRYAAPVDGLETVEYHYFNSMLGTWLPCAFPEMARTEGKQTRELVTRSQAVAIIAAKDEAVKDAKQSRDDWRKLAKDLQAIIAAERSESDEAYEIGKREGYSEAVQEIDLKTGGDGEYRYCTDHDPERHTPDPESMIQRIVERFETLNTMESISEIKEWKRRANEAEAIIAAKDSSIKLLQADNASLILQEKELQSDNAALTARVEELEARNSLLAQSLNDAGLSRDDWKKLAKALETQLATARKALEDVQGYVREERTKLITVDPDFFAKYEVLKKIGKFIREARAALEGQP